MSDLTYIRVGHHGPKVDRMRESSSATPMERALGIEVQAEAKRKGLSHKEIQQLAGIEDKTFRRYFVTGERHIPIETATKVAEVLGLQLSVLMGRAEAGVGLLEDRGEDVDAVTSSPEERSDLRAAIARNAPPATGVRKRAEY